MSTLGRPRMPIYRPEFKSLPRTPRGLTEAQRRVIALMGMGFTNKEIAAKLGTSESNVKQRAVRAYRVIGVNSRTQAALWYQQITMGEQKCTV